MDKKQPRSGKFTRARKRVTGTRLEDQLRSELEFARIKGRSVLAKVPGPKIVAEAAVLTAASELRVVPRVESVSPELEARPPRVASSTRGGCGFRRI